MDRVIHLSSTSYLSSSFENRFDRRDAKVSSSLTSRATFIATNVTINVHEMSFFLELSRLHIYIYICGDVSRIRGRGKIYVGPSAGNKSSDRVLNFDSTDQVGSGGETDAREWWMIVSDKLTESKIDVHAFVPSHPPSSMLNFPAVKLTT